MSSVWLHGKNTSFYGNAWLLWNTSLWDWRGRGAPVVQPRLYNAVAQPVAKCKRAFNATIPRNRGKSNERDCQNSAGIVIANTFWLNYVCIVGHCYSKSSVCPSATLTYRAGRIRWVISRIIIIYNFRQSSSTADGRLTSAWCRRKKVYFLYAHNLANLEAILIRFGL